MKQIEMSFEEKPQRPKWRKSSDSIGERFGRLVVLSIQRVANRTVASCRCDCGSEAAVQMHQLRSGKTASCGCLQIQARISHGKCKSREYFAWSNMIQRCTNPKNRKFHLYGGRGITICERWLASFEAFLEDMGACPPGLTIDRINGNEGYGKSNCRWISVKEQNRNYRRNILSPVLAATIRTLHAGGMRPVDIAAQLGIKPTNVRDVIHNGAWS